MNVGKTATQPAAKIPAAEPYRWRVTNQAASITKQPTASAGNRSPKIVLPNKRVLKCMSSVLSR